MVNSWQIAATKFCRRLTKDIIKAKESAYPIKSEIEMSSLQVNLIAKFREIFPEKRIRAKYIDLVSFASDAGFYYLVLQAVVLPIDEDEIIALLNCRRKA